jgi:hypothetical protein
MDNAAVYEIETIVEGNVLAEVAKSFRKGFFLPTEDDVKAIVEREFSTPEVNHLMKEYFLRETTILELEETAQDLGGWSLEFFFEGLSSDNPIWGMVDMTPLWDGFYTIKKEITERGKSFLSGLIQGEREERLYGNNPIWAEVC